MQRALDATISVVPDLRDSPLPKTVRLAEVGASEFYNSLNTGNPFPFYQKMREKGDIIEVKRDSGPRLFATFSYASTDAALRHPDLSSNVTNSSPERLDRIDKRPLDSFPTSLRELRERFVVNQDGAAHETMRNFFQSYLQASKVRNNADQVEQIARKLLEICKSNPNENPFCIVDKFARDFPLQILASFLNLNIFNSLMTPEEMLKLSKGIVTLHTSCDPYKDASAVVIKSAPYVHQFLAKDPNGQSLLAAWTKDVNRDARSLICNIYFYLMAGHETTMALITNSLFQLMTNRDQMESLRSGKVTAWDAVGETLRFNPPVLNAVRTAVRDFDLMGVEIKRGDHIVAMIGAANRDASKFDNPDSYDISRHAGFGLAFGAGSHVCQGLHLALLEGEVAIKTLIDMTSYIYFVPENPPVRRIDSSISSFNSFPIRVEWN